MLSSLAVLVVVATAAAVADNVKTADYSVDNTTYTNVDVAEYLRRYGYLDGVDTSASNEVQSLYDAVVIFQERHNLTVDGDINSSELKVFMTRPRCGNTDDPAAYSITKHSTKWPTSKITWYWYGHYAHMHLVEAAFGVWSKYTDLTFVRSFHSPNIPILMSPHLMHSDKTPCRSRFDGRGGILAHAYYPLKDRQDAEIHMDEEEHWDYSLETPWHNKTSFFLTLVHEIGHALGLGHSTQIDAIMYSYYHVPFGVRNLRDVQLTADDVAAVQYLYGAKTASTAAGAGEAAAAADAPTAAPDHSSRVKRPQSHNATTDLCDNRNAIDSYFVKDNRIFLFRGNYVWMVDVDDETRTPSQFTKPKRLTDWLTFLPRNFTNVTALYERPNGEIGMFVQDILYVFNYPAMELKYDIT